MYIGLVNDGFRSSASHQYDEYCINKFEVFEVLVVNFCLGFSVYKYLDMEYDVMYSCMFGPVEMSFEGTLIESLSL